MKTTQELCNTIREISYALHCYLGHGHMEKVYENALAIRLKKAGLKIKQQHPVNVYDEDGSLIGEYFVDLLVENCLLLELKACHNSVMNIRCNSSVISNLPGLRMDSSLILEVINFKLRNS